MARRDKSHEFEDIEILRAKVAYVKSRLNELQEWMDQIEDIAERLDQVENLGEPQPISNCGNLRKRRDK